jgi:lipopolysaccharide transport protein LptA
MIASPHQKKIIFQGHVKVTQENIQLTADTLDVYLISTNQSVAITKESVQKVNARGHVRVHWKAYRIEADTAIYLPQKKKLIVNGNMARLYQGKNSIAGSQIVVNLITDQVEISSNKGEQVEAFYEFSEQEMKKIKQQKNNP